MYRIVFSFRWTPEPNGYPVVAQTRNLVIYLKPRVGWAGIYIPPTYSKIMEAGAFALSAMSNVTDIVLLSVERALEDEPNTTRIV